MVTRHKVAEPVWSSQKGKQNNTAARVLREVDTKRRRYIHTNDSHEKSDCYNCERALDGFCTVAQIDKPLKPLEYCAKTYTHCQYWIARDKQATAPIKRVKD